MDEKAVNEILITTANTMRQAEKIFEKAEMLRGMIRGSCSADRALDLLYNKRHVIWKDGQAAWEAVLTFLHADPKKDLGRFDPLLRRHDLLCEVSALPEKFGKLRKSFFSERKARATAKLPYSELKKGYTEAGQYALRLVVPVYLEIGELLGMRHRLVTALEALPQPMNSKPVNSPPVNKTHIREAGGAGSAGLSN